MKPEIILTIVWTSLCLSERQQRSTVLTDESKRIVEHFDFSNFDKQEALNYIDRQRFDNQIRGKRSHTKFTRDRKDINENLPTDLKFKPNAVPKSDDFEIQNTKLNFDVHSETFNNDFIESPTTARENHFKQNEVAKQSRNRRGHKGVKRKSKSKSNDSFGENESEDEDEEDADDELKPHRKKKKSKKKKKKKKKRHYWDNWSEWSPCSVTCGRGRKIRWRKCIAKNCTNGELEMGEKTCQLPACNLLTKLLGL